VVKEAFPAHRISILRVFRTDRGGVAALLSILRCFITAALGKSTHSLNQTTQIKIWAQQG